MSTNNLISGIHLTYKVVILDIKRKQNNFFGIFEILASSRDFNKLVIKAKIRDKTFFIYIWRDNMIFFIIIYFLERLGRMHENKTFFFYKNQVFNTGFVSLQYKNTNQYWSKCSKIFAENHRFLKRIFWFFFIFRAGPIPAHVVGLDPAHLCGWAGLSQPSLVTGPKPVTQFCHASIKIYTCMKLPSHCSSPSCQLTQNAGNTFYHRDCGRK